jgi:hypothetical protein
MDFLQLDAGSLWASDNVMRHYIRDGKITQANVVTGHTLRPPMWHPSHMK